MKLEKGLKLRIEDKSYIYFGYVSRIYKNKLFFEITSSNDNLFQKGRWTIEKDIFQRLINNQNKNIKVEGYN